MKIDNQSIKGKPRFISIHRHVCLVFYNAKSVNLLELRVHGVRLEVVLKSSRLLGEDLMVSLLPLYMYKRTYRVGFGQIGTGIITIFLVQQVHVFQQFLSNLLTHSITLQLIHIIISFNLNILSTLSINREDLGESLGNFDRGIVFGSSIYIFTECFLSVKEDGLDEFPSIVLCVKEWDLSIRVGWGRDNVSVSGVDDTLTWEVGGVKSGEKEGGG
jgi:hypothetical protein